jgi:hypothetical protein
MDSHFILDDLKDIDVEEFANIENFEFSHYGQKDKRIYQCRVTTINYPSLIPIYQKFQDPKRLFSHAEIMYIEPGASVMPHIDVKRAACVNIPVAGDFEKSAVGFFSKGKKFVPNMHTDAEGKVTVMKGGGYPDAILEEEISYTKPIVLNNQKIHNVSNYSDVNRIIISLSFNYNFTFGDINRLHQTKKLLKE